MFNDREYLNASSSSRPGPINQAGNNTANPDSAFTRVPSISLPKGGGSIRGIGEKFAANPVTGTGSMSVPLATSPGRSGFGPQLVLSYDSGAGNGSFGFGWNLSLPSISRKTEKGLPQYRDRDESDVFILFGAEDLVPMLLPDGSRFEDGSSVAGYTIHRYRPRIEGLFARIERWTNQADASETFWRSISRDNITTWYGKTAESRIVDPADSTRIFSWLICQSSDDKGNAIRYEYKAENSDGVDLSAANEKNRSRFAQRYLKRVKYCNQTPRQPDEDLAQGNDWLFEVVFDYGEHSQDDPKPADADEWLCRHDPFSIYRAGFEVRTYRLCQRVLMFHHLPDENIGRDCLAKSTDFAYRETRGDVTDRKQGHPIASFIASVTQTGYKRKAGGGYIKKSLPPLEFKYSEATIHDQILEVDKDSLENLPTGMYGGDYQWVDLDGEGIPGILTEQATAWFYKRNLSPISAVELNGVMRQVATFAPVELVAEKPAFATIGVGGWQILDLVGDGRPDLLRFEGLTPGFFEHNHDGEWDPFVPFRALPNVNWRDPNLRFIDLTGDGLADILVTEHQALTWYASLGETGFSPSERTLQLLDEEHGPRLLLADNDQSIYIADLSGDGLMDLVRIRNGEVCYWPNQGYGRFGGKVTMDHSPWFDEPDQFDHQRIRLADIDGSGVVDIIYLAADGVQLYFNQSGNRWSDARVLFNFPPIDDLTSVQVADLLGNGTACLVWSSPLPGARQCPMRYLDLMGGEKPHLLIKAVNNLGAETRVHYAPSTKFYLADKLAGKPWVTKLPFPVHVVERVETYDHVSRTRFVTSYAYHHGCFDGEEREFRGFGMIEQQDAEGFEDFVVGVQLIEGSQELAPELNQPPVTTRTWYHVGEFLNSDRVSHQFRKEYYHNEAHLPEPVLPATLTADELRECVRALKGLPLRQEIYSFDGSEQQQHPYHVVENSFEIRLLQPRGEQKHAVFFPVENESVSLTYERNPTDPRIEHSLNLEVDQFGNPSKTCSAIYGRKIADPALPGEVTSEQQKLWITYGEADYTEDIDQQNPIAAYRLRVPYDVRSYEITGISPVSGLFKLAEIKAKIADAVEIAYETVADGITSQKRLLSQGRMLFLDNNLNPLPPGQWESLGLVHERYQLALTPGTTGAHYSGKVSDAEFVAAGYLHFNDDANWWIPSGTDIYPIDPARHFYLPVGTKDPLGMETLTTFDQYDLLIERMLVQQASWNETVVVNDYRILGPVLLTDPNKNRSAVEVDALGMVVKSAVMGKEGSSDGDTLADPTIRMEYELFNWMNNGKPNFAHTFIREKHGQANPRWQENYIYSNGSGGIAMLKMHVHPGKALQVDPDGSLREVNANPRWVGNGRIVLNNKGNPVKQYEPYFSTTHEFEDERVLREIGVTSVFYYDPLGRNIRTLFPNGTFTRVEFDPWTQRAFDANDTVKTSEWYVDRGSPDPATEPEPLNDPTRRAAWLTAKHAGTPEVTHFDSFGRTVYVISDYGGGKTAARRFEIDLTGRMARQFDQERRMVSDRFVGMTGLPIVDDSAEKGRRWSFHNVLGALVKTWDAHGREFRTEYDSLHRPVSTFVRQSGQTEVLFNYVVYGDRHPNAVQLNLLGFPHQIFDQAGLMQVRELDFKGNPKSVERILASDYKNNLDWNALTTQRDYAAIQAAARPALEISEVFTIRSEYDALNRPIRSTLPDKTVIVPTYNEANFLASLQAQIRGENEFIEFLKNQDYDAKGQRQFAHYGNEVFTRYFYDPKTFRLTNLLSHKSGDDPKTQALQDLHYTYDAVGNITYLRDDAQQTHYFMNAVVKPENFYEYDAIYQLTRATGRELVGSANDAIRTHADLDFVPQLPHANDTNAVRTYTEEYEYDLLGNLKILRHRFRSQAAVGSGWARHYQYAYESQPNNRTNRLSTTSLPGDPEDGPFSGKYTYDVYGNMVQMPHLAAMTWNFLDQLRQVDLGGGGKAFYAYGSDGQRVRKVIERNGSMLLEWIFLGAVSIFRRRRRDTNALRLERLTLHISDQSGYIAQVDTKTRDEDNTDPGNPLNVPLIRYQYANHLGSAGFETDSDGNVISYEEYHPYGTTAYRSAKPRFDLSLKRYRFTGKERDDETGLYYFGARYYAAWLGRWTSTDPAGFVDGLNLFRYARNSPVQFRDRAGLQSSGTGFKERGEAKDRLYPESTPEEIAEFLRRRGKLLNNPDPTNDVWVGSRERGYWNLGTEATVTPIGPSVGEEGSESPSSLVEPDPSAASVTPSPPQAASPGDSTSASLPTAESAGTASSAGSEGAPAAQPEEGFWKSIVSGNKEAGFWKSLIPVIGSVQNANYHFSQGNWVRGIAYSLLAITDIFLVRSILTGAVKLLWKGGAKLLASELAEGFGRAIAGSWRATGETFRILKSGAGRGVRQLGRELLSVVWQAKTFKYFSQKYWRGTANALGMQLHHVWAMNKSWVPDVLKNSGLNMLEIPRAFNNWMGGIAFREHTFRLFMSTLVKADFLAAYNLTEMATQDGPNEE